jgi:hypothetical protein
MTIWVKIRERWLVLAVMSGRVEVLSTVSSSVAGAGFSAGGMANCSCFSVSSNQLESSNLTVVPPLNNAQIAETGPGSPAPSGWGGMACSLSITVAIAAMDWYTEAMAD